MWTDNSLYKPGVNTVNIFKSLINKEYGYMICCMVVCFFFDHMCDEARSGSAELVTG